MTHISVTVGSLSFVTADVAVDLFIRPILNYEMGDVSVRRTVRTQAKGPVREMTRIFDVFPFFNELDLLEIRLNHLANHVDYFVITEARQTHAGNPKPLYFQEHRHLFQKFEKKIIHHVVDFFPPGLTTFERDWHQRNEVKPILNKEMNEKDLLLYGDVDEIPSIDGILQAIKNIEQGSNINHFAQSLFYYYLNLEEISGTLLSSMGEFPGIQDKKWLGSTISRWAYAAEFTPTELRDPKHIRNSIRIPNGGQHFSYVGGPTPTSVDIRVRTKLQESAHQELNIWRTKSFLTRRLSRDKDIFGRRGANFKTRRDLSYLPAYVLANLEKFESLIKL